MTRHLPNLISALRFPMAAAFVLMDGAVTRVLLVAAAGVSDWADGRLARATRSTSRTGEWLDPLADKVFMVAAVIAVTLDARLPLWVPTLILLRDIGVAAGAALFALLRRPAPLRARRVGKWVTWLQFVAIGAVVLRPALAVWVAPPIGLLGVLALLDYTRSARPPDDSRRSQTSASDRDQ